MSDTNYKSKTYKIDRVKEKKKKNKKNNTNNKRQHDGLR